MSSIASHDVARSLREIGVQEGDICLFHSSFKSLGPVEGGAQAVIDGYEATVGKSGTIVAPTLAQKNFPCAYATWHIDKPSEVGYLTEYFRRLPGTLRSNQATHSVAARGPMAHELTYEHAARGHRLCPFGVTAFCDSSPWRKMYDHNARVVFIGVSMRYHTMKHMIEGWLVENLLARIADPVKREQQKSVLMNFYTWPVGVWPFYNSVLMQEELQKMGLLRATQCGQARLLCVEAKPSSDAALQLLSECPERFVGQKALDWIRACR